MDKLFERAAGLFSASRRQAKSRDANDANDDAEDKSNNQVSNNTKQQHVFATSIKPQQLSFRTSKTNDKSLSEGPAANDNDNNNNNNNNNNSNTDNGKKLRPRNNKSTSSSQQQQQQQQHGGDGDANSLRDCLTPITRSRLATLAQIGEDWLYLALLGIIMAILSFSMDSIITLFLSTRLWLSHEMSGQNMLVQYIAWCVTPILLVIFSTGFVHLCSPTAIGSGIPEMKTILRGVVLNEYLTFRTLIAKIVGLTFTLGSGLPLGKEGPSVHMASIVATLLSKLVASFQGIYENESRTSEMLSAACAVGVAATFYAPIGGVLFSIEVTTVYFAVRNYWRGFFAACCGATVWRLLGFWIKNDESISALFKTNFSTDYPFDPIELLVFSFIGATCGLAGAAYIKFHREIVQFFRRHKRISGFLQQNRFVYPTLVTLIITTSTFPPFIGKYTAATLSTHTTIEHLFSNQTWTLGKQDLASKRILDEWTTPDTNFHLHLVLYIVMLFWTSALASTIPTPSGVFIPVLKMGAAYGRLLGELMASAYPHGIKYSHPAAIVPGSYAVVGAAAFSGAVTHTVSTSVILFEMTGQIVHIIPVILGVLISNAVCQSLQPSIYDSIIEIKKLPYLPPIASSNSVSHRILVRDFMNTDIPFVWKEKCSYADLKALLSANKKIMSFPLVESPHSMKLLGSIARPDLLKLLYMHLGRERRLQEVCRRNSDSLSPALNLLSTVSGRVATGEHQMATQNLGNLNYEERGGGGPLRRSESAPQTSKQQQQMSAMPSTNGADRAKDGDNWGQGAQKARADDFKLAGDRPATRLILHAGPPQQNYGATAAGSAPITSSSVELAATPSSLVADKQLLTDCQKELGDEERELADMAQPKTVVQSIAKIINHYNRGTSMDEEHLDRSIQEVESRMANVTQSPAEIVVVIAPPCAQPDAGGGTIKIASEQELGVTTDPVDCMMSPSVAPQLQEQPASRSDSLLVRSHQPQPQQPASPSLNLRPTKSILKTSSFNNMMRHRNISTQSFTSVQHNQSLAFGQHDNYHHSNLMSSKSNLVSNLKFSIDSNYDDDPTMMGSSTNREDHRQSKEHESKFKLGYEFYQDRNHSQTANSGWRHHVAIETSDRNDGKKLSLAERGNLGAPRDYHYPLREGQQKQAQPYKRKVRLPRLRVVDMTPEEQEQWEKEQLSAHIDVTKCLIDEAPFQLVEQTSLYRVHTLFSMLGLNHAYVTSFGQLVGIVALKDIRYAIERMLQEK